MSKAKPGAIVGAVLGIVMVLTVLIGTVTRVGFVGCCNCLWPIVGGLLATMWYIKGSPVPAKAGDGAVVGLITGVVAGLIYMIGALPIQYFMGGVALLEAQVRQFNPNFPLSGLMILILGAVVGFIIFLVLALIGGLIAVPIFEKRSGSPATPPPPPGYGGTPGAGGYGSNT